MEYITKNSKGSNKTKTNNGYRAEGAWGRVKWVKGVKYIVIMGTRLLVMNMQWSVQILNYYVVPLKFI